MDGILVVNKPKGLTSFDVVYEVRKITKSKKVGHAGTLDPLASGVLVVCLNKATKLVNNLIDDDKEYRLTLKLGETTKTFDAESEVNKICDIPKDIEQQVPLVLNEFRGEILQVPPIYSAKKVMGKPAYALARRGDLVTLKPNKVNILDIVLESLQLPFVTLKVTCSKGTYLRSLAHDIGQKLGCGAYVSDLVRLRSGRFKLENSISLDLIKDPNFGLTYSNYLINQI